MPVAKLSELLESAASGPLEEQLSLGELIRELGDRALAAMIFLLALPNVFPTPPGTSALFGVPLVLLSMQLLIGQRPWLPKTIARRSISRRTLKALVDRVVPWLRKAERLLRPRFPLLTTPLFERGIGGLCALLAVIIMLPIPLGNMLPAFAICLLALGLLEEDGIWVLAGVATAVGSVLLLWGAFHAALAALALFLSSPWGGS